MKESEQQLRGRYGTSTRKTKERQKEFSYLVPKIEWCCPKHTVVLEKIIIGPSMHSYVHFFTYEIPFFRKIKIHAKTTLVN